MIHRIEIRSKVADTRARVREQWLATIGITKKNIKIAIVDVYTVEEELSSEQLDKIGSMLANPVTQTVSYSPKKFTVAIEVGFLPGVTDNIATTVKETIEDLLKIKFSPDEGVYTSQLFFITGAIAQKDIQRITENIANPLIQRIHVKTKKEYEKNNGMDCIVPKVRLLPAASITFVDLNVDDGELITIGKSGIMGPDGKRRGPLALDLTYMKTIQHYFQKLGRNPTDIELESIAQTWSEHCKHTIFRDPIDAIKKGLYKTYVKKATEDIRKKKGKDDFCVSVFTDNSGAIAFDDNFLITHKVETHNSPSALDPFGGAITGIVGVNRDALGFGMGAKPVANYYGYCFGDPRTDNPLYKGPNKTQKMLSARRILDGVVAGVNSGGNCSGIPTPQGFVYFDERYLGKPLVFVGTIGLIPRKIQGKLSHIKKAKPGDLIVMIGGRVGKDGVHGATFASESLDMGSPSTAVQIGDPITQKKLSDAIVYEARDLLLYNSITDNGAGGLSCSVAEMAKESGGCDVHLEKVPVKYAGLEPWEIWISESQERMTLAVPEEKWKKFAALMQKRGVEATVIGTFTNSGKCVVSFNGKTIVDLPLDFLHDGLPQRPMKSRAEKVPMSKMKLPEPKDHNKTMQEMMGRINIASYEFISQQYDSIVQGNAVLGPLQGKGRINGDTSVIRPVLSSKKAVVSSQGLYPTYSEIDPYAMAAASIDTAVRNAVAAGADPDYIAILDNFCWCSPTDPVRLDQLKKAAQACYDIATAYGTPFISGKDSMFNDFKGFDKNNKPVMISILPTLLITSIGVVDDSSKVVSLDLKQNGDLLYLLGETFDEMGGSEYAQMASMKASGIPLVDAKKNKKLYDAYYQAIKKERVAAAQSVGRGGLAIALTKMAMGGMLGIDVDLSNLPGDAVTNVAALYSESQGRIVVSIARENKKAFEKLLNGNTYALIGSVTKEPAMKMTGVKGNEIIHSKLKDVLESYRSTFQGY